MNVGDFDRWREMYELWGFREHREFYELVARDHADQRHFPPEWSRLFFEDVRGDVIELGGWRGEMAELILSGLNEVSSWANREICQWAAENAVCTDPRYEASTGEDWLWVRPIVADVFVASHTIEHLSDEHALALIGALDVRDALVVAPMPEGPCTWRGYYGTHKLEMGFDAVDAAFRERGYAVRDRGVDVRFYRRVT